MGWTWWKRRLEVLFRKRSAEEELDDEIRFHLEQEVLQNMRSGMGPEEARRRALVAFGGVERHKEEVRDVRGGRVVDDLVQDVHIAVRSFLKQPAFLAAVLLTLGLGIGGNVAMFGILDASLLRALPFREPDRLVMGRVTRNGEVGYTVSAPDFFDYRERSTSFTALSAFTPFQLATTMTGEGEPERIQAILVSTGFFATLGVSPALGREFAGEEGELDGPPVVILSHGLWERRFGGDPAVLGRAVNLGGRPYTVVGVMPAGFRFVLDTDLWLPLQRGGSWAQARQFHNFVLVGRLAPGLTVGRAQSDVDRISEALAEAYPDSNRNKGLNLTPLKQALSERYDTTLAVLMAAVAALLLIACGNVAGLLLARGGARRGELAVRSVMGAGRGRLARQLLTENALLALGAGAIGVGLAVWLERGILAFVSLDQLGPVEAGVSLPMLGFAAALSLLTVLVFGVLPALRVAQTDPASDLRSGMRTAGSRRATRFRSGLVVTQVALTCVLLIVSGLLLRSLDRLNGVDPGFETRNLLTAEVQIPGAEYGPEERVTFYRQLRDRVAALPGVEAVGLITRIPIRDPGGNVRVDLPERFGSAGVFGGMADQRVVMPGYFDAMGIPLIAGRDLTLEDRGNAPGRVVISQAVARRVFGEDDPLGRIVGVDTGGEEPTRFEVVGVVGDVVMDHPANGTYPGMYFSYAAQPSSSMRLAIRTRGDNAQVTAAVRQVLGEMDPDVPLSGVSTMNATLSRVVSDNRAIAVVLVLFAAVALLLAAVGLYGVLAYQVSRRLHEIGIRMALGAGTGSVLSSVVRGGLVLVAIGLALGIPASLAAARLVQGMLFGVGAADPVTYAGVAAFLGLVATVACLLPALRAARVDPVRAFRAE
ncbi:MAG: ABC transporter permease [Gemmatimonadota bacterium]